jgi:hypothetical protein
VDDIDELFRASRAVAVSIVRRIADMHTNVVLQYFGHQAIGRAADGHDELHHLFAACFGVEGAFDRFNLSAQALDSVEKLGFVLDGVAHNYYCIRVDTIPPMVSTNQHTAQRVQKWLMADVTHGTAMRAISSAPNASAAASPDLNTHLGGTGLTRRTFAANAARFATRPARVRIVDNRTSGLASLIADG